MCRQCGGNVEAMWRQCGGNVEVMWRFSKRVEPKSYSFLPLDFGGPPGIDCILQRPVRKQLCIRQRSPSQGWYGTLLQPFYNRRPEVKIMSRCIQLEEDGERVWWDVREKVYSYLIVNGYIQFNYLRTSGGIRVEEDGVSGSEPVWFGKCIY